MSIGAYPLISLKEAREAALEAKRQLAQGLDPAAVKRDRKIKEAADADRFKRIGEEYPDKLRGEGRAPTTMKKVEWRLSLAYADIGAKGITKISPADVLATLRRAIAGPLTTSPRGCARSDSRAARDSAAAPRACGRGG